MNYNKHLSLRSISVVIRSVMNQALQLDLCHNMTGSLYYSEPGFTAGPVLYCEPGFTAGPVLYSEPGFTAGPVSYSEPGSKGRVKYRIRLRAHFSG